MASPRVGKKEINAAKELLRKTALLRMQKVSGEAVDAAARERELREALRKARNGLGKMTNGRSKIRSRSKAIEAAGAALQRQRDSTDRLIAETTRKVRGEKPFSRLLAGNPPPPGEFEKIMGEKESLFKSRSAPPIKGLLIVGETVMSGDRGTTNANGEPNEWASNTGVVAGVSVSGELGTKVLTAEFSAYGHASSGKSTPETGLSPEFHYLGATGSGPSSSFGLDSADLTLSLQHKGLSFSLHTLFVDPDPKDDLSPNKLMALGGSTFSPAKYSPIYVGYFGAFAKLEHELTHYLKAYIAGGFGKQPDARLGNGKDATPKFAQDDDKNDIRAKELRAGLIWNSMPHAGAAFGHIAAFQFQYLDADKVSYGGHLTAQIALTDPAIVTENENMFLPHAVQASIRMFSLESGKTADWAAYLAYLFTLSPNCKFTAFFSHVARTKEVEAGKLGTGTSTSKEEDTKNWKDPNPGLIIDKEVSNLTQYGLQVKLWNLLSLTAGHASSSIKEGNSTIDLGRWFFGTALVAGF